jgi:hypothetical protein
MKMKFFLMLCLALPLDCFSTPTQLRSNPLFPVKDYGDSGPVRVVPKVETITCNGESNFFQQAFGQLKNLASDLAIRLDPCIFTREAGAQVYCECVEKFNQPKAKSSIYQQDLKPEELGQIKKDLIALELDKRTNKSLINLSNFLMSELRGDGEVEGCLISEIREIGACSKNGMETILKALPPEYKNFKGDLKELFDEFMYKHIVDTHAAFKTKHGKEILTKADYLLLVTDKDDKARLTKFITSHVSSIPQLIKEIHKLQASADSEEKQKALQIKLQELNKLFSYEENVWTKHFQINQNDKGLELTLNQEEVIRSLNDENHRLVLDFKKEGGSAEEAVEALLERKDGLEHLVDGIESSKMHSQINWQTCDQSRKMIENLCADKVVGSDLVDKCFDTTHFFSEWPINPRLDMALCQSVKGRGIGFFAFENSTPLGAMAMSTDVSGVSDYDVRGRYDECKDKQAAMSLAAKNRYLNPGEKETRERDKSFKQIWAAPTSLPVDVSEGILSNVFAGIKRSSRRNNDTVAVINDLSSLDVAPIKAMPRVEKSNEFNTDDFVNGGDKAKLPGQNEWENYKSQTNVPPAVEAKYEQLKAEDKEISDKEKDLVRIEKELIAKQEKLDIATKALKDKQDAQAQADLQKLKDEFAGLKGQLESSKEEIKSLRNKHEGNVENFRSQVASIAPSQGAEPARAAAASTSFSSANNSGNSRSSFNESERTDAANSSGANTPANTRAGNTGATRAAMAAGGAGASRSTGSSGGSAGGVANNSAPITLSSELTLTAKDLGRTIEIYGLAYEVVELKQLPGVIILKNGDNLYTLDKTGGKNKLLPVDKNGKKVLAKETPADKKENTGRVPASETPKRSRKPFSVLDLNRRLKNLELPQH